MKNLSVARNLRTLPISYCPPYVKALPLPRVAVPHVIVRTLKG